MNNIIHISFAGPTIKLPVGDKMEVFEMHHYCGPIKLKKDGDPSERQWGERNPFWSVFSKWMDAGQKVDEDGVGILE
jgi:hypothetical protein